MTPPDGPVLQNPPVKAPDSNMMPGMAAPLPCGATIDVMTGEVIAVGDPIYLTDTSISGPVQLQEPSRWIYDIDAATGASRAQYPGEVITQGTMTAASPLVINGGTSFASILFENAAGYSAQIDLGPGGSINVRNAVTSSPTLGQPPAALSVNPGGQVVLNGTIAASSGTVVSLANWQFENTVSLVTSQGALVIADQVDTSFNTISRNADSLYVYDSIAGSNLVQLASLLLLLTVNTQINGNLSIAAGGTLNPTGGIRGVTNSSSAPAGFVGEYMANTSTAAIGLTSGTYTTVASLTLTGGDWDVQGSVVTQASGTNLTGVYVQIVPAEAGGSVNGTAAYVGPAMNYFTAGTAPIRQNVNANTTMNLQVDAVFSTGTATGFGTITARRRR